MIGVTADTNVIVSGLVYQRGKPYELLQRALNGEINLATSQAILDEMADVLVRKFGATAEEIAEAQQVMKYAARKVNPAVHLNVVKADPDDDRILECAVSAGSDYIVSGDKHLLRLRVYDGIHILNVADFLQRKAKGPGR